MGRGRKPSPTSIKILKGTQPCRINTAEPRPAPGRPVPPDDLTPAVRAEWDRVCDQLEHMKVLNSSHGFALNIYCSSYSRLLAANESIAKDGMFIESGGKESRSPGGRVVTVAPTMKTNPAVLVAAAAEGMMIRVLTEFGLTAASISKVRVEKPNEDALDAFVARRKV